MDEDDVVRKTYEVEQGVYTLNDGLKSDLCSLSTGQKLDVVYSIQHSMKVLKEIHEELAHDVFEEMKEFVEGKGYAIGNQEHDC